MRAPGEVASASPSLPIGSACLRPRQGPHSVADFPSVSHGQAEVSRTGNGTDHGASVRAGLGKQKVSERAKENVPTGAGGEKARDTVGLRADTAWRARGKPPEQDARVQIPVLPRPGRMAWGKVPTL